MNCSDLGSMKKTLLTILVVSASLILMSCNKGDSEKGSYSPPYYTPESYTGIENELKLADFFCSTSIDCPKNVGLIFSNMDGNNYNPKIGQCTGFLIAEDIVATNSHCIPDHLKTSSFRCDSQIAIRFLDSSSKKNIFACKELLKFSPLGIFDPDYAFFRIEKSGKEPFVINKQGLKDNQPIRVPRITPLNSSIGGRLEIERCKVGLGTLLNYKATNSWSKTGVGLGCQVTKGNSGSPVINEAGEVIGILQSMLLENYRKLIAESFKSFKLELPRTLIPHMLFTSLSCVADPATGLGNEQKCSDGEKISIVDCLDFKNEKTEANSRQVYDQWKRDLPPIFVYEFVSDESIFTTQAQPICIKPKSKYDGYEHFVTLAGPIGFRKEKLDLVYPHSVDLGPRFAIDDEYRFKSELQFVEVDRSYFSINLVKENGRWIGTTNSTYVDWRARLDFRKVKIPESLPECTDRQMNSGDIVKIKLASGGILTEQEYRRRQAPQEKKICER